MAQTDSSRAHKLDCWSAAAYRRTSRSVRVYFTPREDSSEDSQQPTEDRAYARRPIAQTAV